MSVRLHMTLRLRVIRAAYECFGRELGGYLYLRGPFTTVTFPENW